MKHLIYLFSMCLVAFFFYYVVLLLIEEQYILPSIIIPIAGVRLDQWLSSFRLWGGIGIFSALAASIIWYILAQWVLRVTNLSDAGKRGVWFLLMLIPFLAIVAAFIFTRKAQVGMGWVYTLYFVNALLCYYVATALFSPSSYKYTPLLSSFFRRW